MQSQFSVFPGQITVHLGPPDSMADNITIPFYEYILNVASSELSPHWPENLLCADIYVIISLALNRIYSSLYPSLGYEFDITSSPEYDQKFIRGRETYCNISALAGTLMGSYITRRPAVGPLEAYLPRDNETQAYAFELANRGYSPIEILKRLYGNDISIIKNVPLEGCKAPETGFPIMIGSRSPGIARIQIILNRISDCFPTIPKIPNIDGIYGESTADAVAELKRVTGLLSDNQKDNGILGRSEWCAMMQLYQSIINLEKSGPVPRVASDTIAYGDEGPDVAALQRMIGCLSCFYCGVRRPEVDGIFGDETLNSLIDAQRALGVTPDGIAGHETIDALRAAIRGAYRATPGDFADCDCTEFLGEELRLGSEGEVVAELQRYLSDISSRLPDLPPIAVTGYFGNHTRASVLAAQKLLDLRQTGNVDAETWDAIASLWSDLQRGSRLHPGQFPGYTLCCKEDKS